MFHHLFQAPRKMQINIHSILIEASAYYSMEHIVASMALIYLFLPFYFSIYFSIFKI